MTDDHTPTRNFKNRMRELRIPCHQDKEREKEIKKQSDEKRCFEETTMTSESFDKVDSFFR